MRRLIPAAVFVLAAAACGGTVTPSPTPRAVDIRGTLAIEGAASQHGRKGERCVFLDSGYSDIREGTQVIVTDPSGKTIALGRLGVGTLDKSAEPGTEPPRCLYPFRVSAPAGHAFYGVEVGNRGRLQYTADQLRTPLELELK